MTAVDSPNTILLTGGCGYIGSHAIFCLLTTGIYSVVIVDSLINSSEESVRRAASLAGLSAPQVAERVSVKVVDISDESSLRTVFVGRRYPFVGCIHFAGLKAVGESTRLPLTYYQNNIGGTLVLLKLMEEFDCRSIVFSSSATVYGSTPSPINESSAVGLGITNAYGRTKFMIEEILRDHYDSAKIAGTMPWSITILRYFNPVGAHPSGEIGEDPSGIPNNLSPFIAQVAVGRRPYLSIYGNDYDTPDGTGVRDYLHVMDLVEGHLSAIKYMEKKGNGLYTFNLGTGNGLSVLDMVKAMEKACGHEIKYKFSERRPGDLATVYSDASLAKKELGWEATRNVDDMCRDLWAWQSKNPNGYSK